jgi:hypothetical protein
VALVEKEIKELPEGTTTFQSVGASRGIHVDVHDELEESNSCSFDNPAGKMFLVSNQDENTAALRAEEKKVDDQISSLEVSDRRSRVPDGIARSTLMVDLLVSAGTQELPEPAEAVAGGEHHGAACAVQHLSTRVYGMGAPRLCPQPSRSCERYESIAIRHRWPHLATLIDEGRWAAFKYSTRIASLLSLASYAASSPSSAVSCPRITPVTHHTH